MKQRYIKKAISVPDQINHLSQKNLIFNDINKAEHCLAVVGYYRLSIYFNAFIDFNSPDKKFKSSTSFEHIWSVYAFDRKLRLLVADAIEKIEVALRAALTNTLAMKYGVIWYTLTEPFGKTWTRKNEKGLTPKLIFENEISRIINRKNPEDFIKNYKKNYLPESPPSWMLLECLPLGSIAAIFKHLGNMKDKKEIAKSFKEPATILDSWFESIRYTRNLCAHHSRLWNQWFVIEPKVSKSMGQIKTKERSFHQQAMILHKLNRALSPKSSWHNKLRELFENYSEFVPFEQMGFIEDWKKDEFWSL